MILDTLDAASRYAGLHPRFQAAFDFLRSTDLASLADGRHELDGAALYANVDRVPGRGREAAKLEAHRRYIDIQYMVSGAEEIGWLPLGCCESVDLPYDADRDVGLFADAPSAWVAVPPGHFVIYWPDDAHAPLAGTGDLVKVVVKVAVDD